MQCLFALPLLIAFTCLSLGASCLSGMSLQGISSCSSLPFAQLLWYRSSLPSWGYTSSLPSCLSLLHAWHECTLPCYEFCFRAVFYSAVNDSHYWIIQLWFFISFWRASSSLYCIPHYIHSISLLLLSRHISLSWLPVLHAMSMRKFSCYWRSETEW